ncbi:hypothetical protein SAMN05877838_3116 [Hoeflea halophila]|uniref:Uncharacterized protein n=1 Tax=Hoeflea halophila TaxID=714899 RepID=A0A286IDJ9_9HYPH|nr:hypothetical protein [Hoeflea halophila]SOE18198.1 hypothetical protein SAMN05877838_3116 [Hoeflea halophila]
MSTSRSEKLARLVRVQRQVERMAEYELSLTLSAQAETDATQEALVHAVGSFNPIHTAMSHQYAQRFQRLSARSQLLTGAIKVQEGKVLTEKTKADRLADHAAEAAEAEDRLNADESLFDLLDSTIKSGGFS